MQIGFPLGLYFQQLFATDIYVRFINPWRFWHRYKIDHLENCREFNTVRYLESCHQIEDRPQKLEDPRSFDNCGEIILENKPNRRNDESKITFIIRPGSELKYRGIAYHNHKIIAIEQDRIAIEPNSLTVDTAKKFGISYNDNPKSSTLF